MVLVRVVVLGGRFFVVFCVFCLFLCFLLGVLTGCCRIGDVFMGYCSFGLILRSLVMLRVLLFLCGFCLVCSCFCSELVLRLWLLVFFWCLVWVASVRLQVIFLVFSAVFFVRISGHLVRSGVDALDVFFMFLVAWVVSFGDVLCDGLVMVCVWVWFLGVVFCWVLVVVVVAVLCSWFVVSVALVLIALYFVWFLDYVFFCVWVGLVWLFCVLIGGWFFEVEFCLLGCVSSFIFLGDVCCVCVLGVVASVGGFLSVAYVVLLCFVIVFFTFCCVWG